MGKDYFKELMYTENNEDLEFIIKNLGIKRNDKVAVVTSSGCVAFSCLLSDPMEVAGFDINEAQTAYAYLRRAAHKRLNLDEYKLLLGYKKAKKKPRLNLYRLAIKEELPKSVAKFWSQNSDMIADGVVNQSYFYKKMSLIAKASNILKMPGFRSTIKIVEIVKENLPSERLRRYTENYDIGELVLHGSEDPTVRRIFGKIDDYTPPMMEGGGFLKIKRNIRKADFCTKTMTEGLKSLTNVNVCYLSNITDYLPEEENEELFNAAEESCAPGARILALQRTGSFDVEEFARGTKLEIERNDLAKESRATAYGKNPDAKVTLLRKR